MAKTEYINNSSSFYVKNPSFPELNFGLEITKDSSPTCDFDIESLLSDNARHQTNQHTDNDCWNERKNDNEDRCSTLSSLKKAESSKFSSLGALAESHLKENRMLPELSFDGDFNLSDLLANDDGPVVNNSKNVPSENDNLFDLCLLTEDDNPNVERTSGAKDISFDDLTDWINSSVTQAGEIFYHPHLSCDDTEAEFEKILSVSLKKTPKDIDSDTQMSVCLDGVQGKSDYMNDTSTNIFSKSMFEILIDSLDTIDSSETDSGKCENTNELSDSDFLPDIDLTFCIKKNCKNNFSLYGNSLETVDSGFDESDFIPDKLIIPSEKNSFYKDILVSASGNYNKNVTNSKVKASLFSRAISVRPKIDDVKKSKLKNVLNELLKGSMPLMEYDQQIKSQDDKTIIDQSNEHVIVSSYQKLGDEK